MATETISFGVRFGGGYTLAALPLHSIIEAPMTTGTISQVGKGPVWRNQRFLQHTRQILGTQLVPTVSQSYIETWQQFVIELNLHAACVRFTFQVIESNFLRTLIHIHYNLAGKMGIVIICRKCSFAVTQFKILGKICSKIPSYFFIQTIG